jgi:hypothetical protein
MGDLFLRFVAAALGGVFVFLEDAVEGLALDILRMGGQIVLHAVWQLGIGPIGHGSCSLTNRGCWKNEQSTIPIPLNQVGPVPFCVGPVPETQNFTRPGGVTSWGHENQYRSLSLTTRKPCHTRLCRLLGFR